MVQVKQAIWFYKKRTLTNRGLFQKRCKQSFSREATLLTKLLKGTVQSKTDKKSVIVTAWRNRLTGIVDTIWRTFNKISHGILNLLLLT